MNTKLKSLILRPHEIRHALEHGCGQIRRVVKPQPDGVLADGMPWVKRTIRRMDCSVSPPVLIVTDKSMDGGQICRRLKSPFGTPGHRVWVRETWGLHDTQPSDGAANAHVYYRAADGDHYDLRYQLWRPSTQMPRWASRLTLEITSRVERVQEISKEDCIAEGIQGLDDVHAGWHQPFADLWDSRAKPGERFGDNPFVWVGEYKVVEVEK